MRQLLDGETVLGERIRVYFGQETDIEEKDNHLSAPEAKKLFFISPPPSPPVGWTMRDEEPPNRDVHAEDLAGALARVSQEAEAKRRKEETEKETEGVSPVKSSFAGRRSRSSTLVFDPEHHSTGSEVDLPAIAVEDYADDEEGEDVDMLDEGRGKPMVHTARPPVELMEE